MKVEVVVDFHRIQLFKVVVQVIVGAFRAAITYLTSWFVQLDIWLCIPEKSSFYSL